MTGAAVRPDVKVLYAHSSKDVPASAYTVTYENNVSAGTATVKIVGATMGTLTKTFTILYDMSAMTLNLLNPLSGSTDAYAFSGAAVEPKVSLTVGGQVVPASAYIVSYKDNTTASASVDAKTASLTVTPAGSSWADAAATKTANFALVAAPVITTGNTNTLQNAFIGSAYSKTLAATGATPVKWSVSSGALPDGLTLDETTGVISGTPTAAGGYTAAISAANAAGSSTKTFTWNLGTVGGRMTYADGTGAADVTVQFSTTAGEVIATETTDADGYYQTSIASSVTAVNVAITRRRWQSTRCG